MLLLLFQQATEWNKWGQTPFVYLNKRGLSPFVLFSLLLYQFFLFLLRLLEVISMYCNLLFHLRVVLCSFDNFLLLLQFCLQIFHLTHLYYILMCSNHLVLLTHTYLYYLFLLTGILLCHMLVYQIFYQNVPKQVLNFAVLHMSILRELFAVFHSLFLSDVLNTWPASNETPRIMLAL